MPVPEHNWADDTLEGLIVCGAQVEFYSDKITQSIGRHFEQFGQGVKLIGELSSSFH